MVNGQFPELTMHFLSRGSIFGLSVALAVLATGTMAQRGPPGLPMNGIGGLWPGGQLLPVHSREAGPTCRRCFNRAIGGQVTLSVKPFIPTRADKAAPATHGRPSARTAGESTEASLKLSKATASSSNISKTA